MSKRIKKILASVGISVFLFFYFWGLSYTGDLNRAGEKSVRYQKGDTVLAEGWKFHPGSDPNGASPELNDSSWAAVNTMELPESYQGEMAWFRLYLQADTHFLDRPVALEISHSGASEIYLDGLQVASFGKVAGDKETEQTIDPRDMPVNIHLRGNGPHLIAVRYSNLHFPDQQGLESMADKVLPGFRLTLKDQNSWIGGVFSVRASLAMLFSIGAFLLTLSFIHFLLFLFYRKAKGDLFFSLFAFCYSVLFFTSSIESTSASPEIQLFSSNIMLLFLNPLLFLSLLLFVYRIYQDKFPKHGWIAVGVGALSVLSIFLNWNTVYYITLIWFVIFTVMTILLGTFREIREKRPGIRILATGIGIFAVFIFLILSAFFYYKGLSFSSDGWMGMLFLVVVFCALLSIPISTSIYLAFDFSNTNRTLSRKLDEVKELSERTISQEKEKQEILSKQKEMLEVQVKERTREVVEQKKVIEEKNKDITDSINYARRIQDAILPSEEQIRKMLPDSFVLYKPKDIVSGDFYFIEEVKGKVIAAAVDCTGHGVPGAFMSMVGHNHLNRIVNEQEITDTSKILDELHKQVLHSLNRDMARRDSKDGMDVAIVSIDLQKKEVQFSGAVRPLYYYVNGSFNEIKGERYSIAGIKEIGSAPFASAVIPVSEPTTFYLFSDGFADQFGGKEGKKLMSKHFRELLTSIQGKPMKEQKQFLDHFIEDWKGGREQMDDVMVIGIRIA